jgi:hypothetical protein
MKNKHFAEPPASEFILVKGDQKSAQKISFADACLFSTFRLLIHQAKYAVKVDQDLYEETGNEFKYYEIDVEKFGVEIHTIHLICDTVRGRPVQES